MRAWWAIALTLGTVGAFIVACSSDACDEDASCAGNARGDQDADGSAPALPEGCNLAVSPKDSPTCVADVVGVFVSDTGSDANDGTKASPVRSIAKALEIQGSRKRIYVCAGAYGALTLTSRIQLFGGFSCADWSYTGAHAKVTAEAGAMALVAKKISDSTIEDVDFESANAVVAGGSSLAAIVVDSALTVRRVGFRAGVGQPGQNQPASGGVFSPATAKAGGTGQLNAGAPYVSNPACPQSTGGAGGPPSSNGTDGEAGEPELVPSIPDYATGVGGEAKSSETAAPGSNGGGGGAGSGAASHGQLTPDSWTPEGGKNGGAGGFAQGGGGGGSNDGLAPGGGAGGGPGGCGGAGGSGGPGGGSSIALVIIDSTVTLEESTVVAANAGGGGSGGGGQIGQIGGPAGVIASGDGTLGAGGGVGGSGGGGGGGAGGLSIGILWSGATAPSADGQAVERAETHARVTLGVLGPGGAHGQGAAAAITGAVAGLPGTDGKPGIAQAVLKQ